MAPAANHGGAAADPRAAAAVPGTAADPRARPALPAHGDPAPPTAAAVHVIGPSPPMAAGRGRLDDPAAVPSPASLASRGSPAAAFPHPLLSLATGVDTLATNHPFTASPAQATPLEGVSPTNSAGFLGHPPPRAGPSADMSLAARRRANMGAHGFTDIHPLDHMPGALSLTDDHTQFQGPSSAPPTPSVISVTHPSQFIHTHHPRRGSLTPLGLNVISPVLPGQGPRDAAGASSFPPRGGPFHPAMSGDAHSEPAARRDSVASTASNLTATRPSHYAMSSIGSTSSAAAVFARRSSLTPSSSSTAPPNFNPSRRRSSLTPSLPTLSAPSPTRALVSGRIAKGPPGTEASTLLPRALDTTAVAARRASATATMGAHTRRGSLPHLYYGAWTGPTTPRASEPWVPTLPSQRGSVGETTAVIDSSFKFGNPPGANDDSPPQRHSPSTSRRRNVSAFEAAEEEEADRQRRAFLAATYGEDSRRARARLSLGGPLGASPGSPASTRRQSLLLWERIHKSPDAAGSAVSVAGIAAAAAAAAAAMVPDEQPLRRPSLPVSIPMRTPPTQAAQSFDDQSIWDNPDAIEPEAAPVRPLPPLLPLSDPVPRLLPSTLALHRATHLLNSRGVSSEPLPAPLPPSLHPPAPVDLSEFDIDFILAGSRSNLGRQGSTTSSSKRPSADLQNGPPFRGPEEEDSFAKFVGAFDDEYGGRRGDWTFRASQSTTTTPGSTPSSREEDAALGRSDRPRPRAEWDSPGAGRYEIYPNGDVRSVSSGAVWRIRKTSSREYEFEQPLRSPYGALNLPLSAPLPSEPQPLVLSICGGYTLAGKLAHTEHGGVKLPLAVQRELKSKRSRVSRRFAAAKHRQSISIQDPEPERTKRLGSEDSGSTAIPIHRPGTTYHHSYVHGPAQSSFLGTPRPLVSSPTSPMDDMHVHNSQLAKDMKRLSRNRKDKDKDKDSEEDRGKKTSIGGVLKRGLFRAQSLVKEYEERSNRHIFTNGSHKDHAHGHAGHSPNPIPGAAGSRHSPIRPSPTERPLSYRRDSSASSQQSSYNRNESTDELSEWPEYAPFGSLGLGIEDEQNGGQPWKEGKAWDVVPEQALAMVIPITSDSRDLPSGDHAVHQPFINPFFVDGPRQALLVWFTPFDSGAGTSASTNGPVSSGLSREDMTGLSSTSTLFKIPEASPHEEAPTASPHGTSLRLPKLLRPRGHRTDSSHHHHHNHHHHHHPPSGLGNAKTIPIPPPTSTPPSDLDTQNSLSGGSHSRRESRNFQPLPFKAFRVVAKVVDTEELRSEPEVPVIALEQWSEQRRTRKPAPSGHALGPSAGLHTPPLDDAPVPLMPSDSSRSPSITDTSSSVLAGRAFPTVIAVCHSQKAGVEFVLEGLDRLGLCAGGSAWGPTGYEEWRGTGLSENGRKALDLLWAACVAVMGL